MYLKEIVTNGFKSFADKIDLKLDDKITCIVGPNGSGKSNVVDAVRWVLGEQSVKSLRGDGSMSDVIFSGSKSRNPLNVATVELVFDNSDHFLNVPYTDISIKRKVYRSGENEYFLNNEKCRLKDVLNLLMDSGVGKESFNIISQGEVDRILSNSSYDRRVVFEEAAGIIKYKKRKEEALRKLDRTHNNIDRVNDIITELEVQVEPLKEQSKKAHEYLENKKGLDKYEVALLANDIEFLNNELEKNETQKEELEKEIISLSNESTSNDAKTIEDNNKLEKLERKLKEVNDELLRITEEVEKLNGEKKLLKERMNSNKEEEEINNRLRDLLEEEGNLNHSIEVNNKEIEIINSNLTKYNNLVNVIREDISKSAKEKNVYQSEYSRIDREIINIKHKIDNLTVEIENGGNIPNSVKSILRSDTLEGIYDTIGNVISVSDEYVKALEIAISASKNFIITRDEDSAKSAIKYLKDNHLGRATFFPLTVIKERYVDSSTLNDISNNPDFIGVVADLVEFDKKYKNVIYNQLGNVLLSPNIDSATRLSKIINNRYKIVTLDGDVVHVGGSMSGGSTYQSRSIISLKQELNLLEMKQTSNEESLIKIKNNLNDIETKLDESNNKYLKLAREKAIEEEKLNSKLEDIKLLANSLENTKKEIENFKGLKNNSLSDIEEKIITEYNEKNTLKDKLNLDSKNISKEIEELKFSIEERLATDKVKNSNLRNLEKQVNELNININRNDVKLDNMLNTLNEDYSLTFERAKKEYELDIEVEEARKKVNLYKSNIKKIGMVNLASIEEFERVNTRYEFLIKQREDLLGAEATLLEIMDEMDDVMKEEFALTFEKIRSEFKEVFKELFGGGSADLKLTNPDDLLSTGVEIVASPPGKKLTTISLLSGGEKTFTAISLLFAILNVKTLPFCLFDEVEAALDEANVEAFGKYLNHYKNKTQFLIITHKKKTMEFADTLYGITMQESGVSKLVSVKLNDKIETM